MKKSGLNRRDFLKFSAFTGTAALLAACAPAAPGAAPAAGGDAAPAAEGNTVAYWWGWPNLDPAMNIIVEQDGFKELMGGTTVELKGNTNEQALLTALAGGTPPDA